MEDACTKARHFGLSPKKISFFLKSKDFKYYICRIPLSTPTNAPEILFPLIEEKFKEVYKKGVLYRTTGVTLEELVGENTAQMDLFGGGARAKKFESIHKQIDSLEDKYGKRVVYLASTHEALKHKVKGTDADEVDRNLLFL